MQKATNLPVTNGFLMARTEASLKAGFKKQRWIEFCEYFLTKDLEILIYEARQTRSKYITLFKNGKSFKVRFSNHMPAKHREIGGDCDFFVGRTHTGVRTTDDAIATVNKFFNLKGSYGDL